VDRLAIGMENGEPLYSQNRLTDEESADIWELEGSPSSGYTISNKRSRDCPLYAKGGSLGCHQPLARPAPSGDQMRWFFNIVPEKKIAEKIEQSKDEDVGVANDADDGMITYFTNSGNPTRRIGVSAGTLTASASEFTSPD